MTSNYLADLKNIRSVLTCELKAVDRSVQVELSSVEETNRICKLDKITIFNTDCKIIRLGESLYGGTMNTAN